MTTHRTRIVLIHAVKVAVDPISEAFAAGWPEAETINLLDDSLSRDLERDGKMTPSMMSRMSNLMRYGIDIGARGIIFTCSAFGDAIEAARAKSSIPVLKPNEAMFERAMEMGNRVGLLATFQPSIASMEEEFHRMAGEHGKSITLESVWVQEAMDALRSGDGQSHDRLIARAAPQLSSCDAIMLAQFSMARASAVVSRTVECPVLTSPDSAVSKMKQIIDETSESLPLDSSLPI